MNYLVKLRRIETRDLRGRRLLVLPYFLRDAYKTGYSREELGAIKFDVEFLGADKDFLYFVITVPNKVLGRILVQKIKELVGSYLEVYPFTSLFLSSLELLSQHL